MIREATMDDALPVCLLMRTLGLLTSPSDLEGAQRLWTRYWIQNPARLEAGAALPIGWIMEYEGRIVGFFGNIPMQYRMNGRDLLAGVATSWGVEKAFRSRTMDLARQYFNQPHADLVLITTAILPAGRLCLRLGGHRLPQDEYEEILFWVLDPRAFLNAALSKKKVHRLLGALVSHTAASALKLLIGLQRRRPGRSHPELSVEVVGIDGVDDSFTELWRSVADHGRLVAYRRAEDLKWHFAPHAAENSLSILRCDRGGRLAGYLVLGHEHVRGIGLSRAKILDMLVLDDDENVIDALFKAADVEARVRGCHVLELIGLTRQNRRHLRSYRPFSRRAPAFPFFYKAMSDDLDRLLASENAWYTTLYDGDGSL